MYDDYERCSAKQSFFFYLQKKCTPFVAQGRPWNKLDTIVKLWNRRQGKRGGFFYFEKNPEDNAENQGNKARNESRVSGLYHLSSSARDIIIIHLVLCAHVMRICLFDFVFFLKLLCVPHSYVCMYVRNLCFVRKCVYVVRAPESSLGPIVLAFLSFLLLRRLRKKIFVCLMCK